MRLQDRTHHVTGAHTLNGARMSFLTDASFVSSDARQAMASGRTFTVRIQNREVSGKVLAVERTEAVKPEWAITMLMSL
jgi:hypothetical protein